MGISRRRVRRLERDAQEEMTLLVCPECAEEFELYGDPALEFVAHEWAQTYEGETYGPPTDPAVVELWEHEHDPSALIDGATGEPWLEWLENRGDPMAINRGRINRLERDVRGGLESFELLDGGRYFFDPLEVHKELFLCGHDHQLGRVGEPPEIFRKICEARDPAAVLERLAPDDPEHVFVNPAELYDREILVTERRLVPLAVDPPEDLSEP